MSINDLVKIADDQRDPQWENDFFMSLSKSNLKLLSQDPQVGPDGWPYLLTETGSETEATEPAQKIIQWLATKGMGLVVNPQKEYPDYVFSFGMIWHFRETGLFYRAKPEVNNGNFEITEGAKVHAGEPTPQYLPQYVRNILKEFLRDQSVFAPKILVMSSDRINYDLAFSLESLGNPPVKEHQGVAEALSWFLPPHYSIVLVSEKGLPPFVNL